jgi:MinD-like ATPase involved in chromosome partitioning or flagellar assembly
MDPDFLTRYLPEHGAGRETGYGDPTADPDVSDPALTEPGADLTAPTADPPRSEETTTVLPPDVHAAIRAQAARPLPASDAGARPAHPPASPHAAAAPVADRRQPPVPAGPPSVEPEQPAPQLDAVEPEGKTTPVAPAPRPASTPPTDPRMPAPVRYNPAPPRPAGPSHPAPGHPAARNAAPPRPGAAPAWDASAPIPATAPYTPSASPAAALRPDELVRQRKLPPEMGWRKGVYVGTAHLVNLGAGPEERELREQIDRIGSNIPGNYTIAVVSIKGGVGKTRTTACLGTVYATYRTEPVLAIDANPTYGSLGRVIDSQATASIRDYMADDQVNTYPKARSYTGKNRQGLEVLGGNQNVASPLAMTDELFTDALRRAQRFYQLTVVDCGNHIEHRVMRGVLPAADSLVIVGTMNYDGAEAAERTIDWLAARNLHPLLRRSALVLNDVNNCYNGEFFDKVRERLEPRVGGVTLIPFDKHLRDGAELDFDALRTPTQRAYIQLAAWLAQGFATPQAGAR